MKILSKIIVDKIPVRCNDCNYCEKWWKYYCTLTDKDILSVSKRAKHCPFVEQGKLDKVDEYISKPVADILKEIENDKAKELRRNAIDFFNWVENKCSSKTGKYFRMLGTKTKISKFYTLNQLYNIFLKQSK